MGPVYCSLFFVHSFTFLEQFPRRVRAPSRPFHPNKVLKLASKGSDLPPYDGGDGDGDGDCAGRGAFRFPERNNVWPQMPGLRGPKVTLRASDMTDDLKLRVQRVMIDAFDNLPPAEVEQMLSLLWAVGPDAGPQQDSLKKLVALTERVEQIEEEAISRVRAPGSSLEDLEDSIRVARSRIRMYSKDADYYNGNLSLDPWKLPWQ